MKTIEDYFLSFSSDLSVFPGGKDYTSHYQSFKSFMDRCVHPEVKTMVTRLEDEIYLNDHSANHIKMVIEKVSLLLQNDYKLLHPLEYFYLLMAIQIHDAGHIFGGRKGHEQNSINLLEEISKYNVDNIEKRFIFSIARAHSGKDDPIGKLEATQDYSNVRIRTRALAALLRFGDELADENSRSSQYLLDKGLVEPKSELFHAFSSCLYSFKPVEGKEIKMLFSIDGKTLTNIYKKPAEEGVKDVYLIDEIYIRTFKTFQECMYYNRFLIDEKFRLNAVSVNIKFLNPNSLLPFLPDIDYKIIEKGYPSINTQDIKSYIESNQELPTGSSIRDQIKLND